LAVSVHEKKLNFSYKKTTLIPGKIPDESVQNAFVETIKDIISKCVHTNNEFYFFDPAHQIHNNINGKAWQLKGKKGTVQVKSNTGRRRVNIIGALNALKPEVTSIITEENCNKELVVRDRFKVLKNDIIDGKCPKCNTKIAGVWEKKVEF